MSSAQTPEQPKPPERPRQVSTAGTLTIAGSGAVLAMLVYLAGQLRSLEMRDFAQDVADRTRDAGAEVGVDTVITIVRYSIMVGAVLSGTALILGVFVLRRHRAARIGLTGLGAFAAVASLAFGPVGWIWTFYIAIALGLLWSKPARQWFDFGIERRASMMIPPPPPPPWQPGYRPLPPDHADSHRQSGGPPAASPPPGWVGPPVPPPPPGWVWVPRTGWVWVPPPPGWIPPPPRWVAPPPGWVPPSGSVAPRTPDGAPPADSRAPDETADGADPSVPPGTRPEDAAGLGRGDDDHRTPGPS